MGQGDRGKPLWRESIWASLVAQTVKNLPAMQEAQVQSRGGEDPLETGMAAHCSILAWGIPWTEEPGGLWSTGPQRAGHDWVTNTFTFFIFAEPTMEGFPHSAVVKESTCNAGDTGDSSSTPGWGSNEYSGLISFRMDWFDLESRGSSSVTWFFFKFGSGTRIYYLGSTLDSWECQISVCGP